MPQGGCTASFRWPKAFRFRSNQAEKQAAAAPTLLGRGNSPKRPDRFGKKSENETECRERVVHLWLLSMLDVFDTGLASLDGTLSVAVLRNCFELNAGGRVFVEDFLQQIEHLVESPGDLELLREVGRCRFAEMKLLGEEGLGVHEWVHSVLLRASRPGYIGAKHLNRQLRTALEKDKDLLQRLQDAFAEADVNHDGLLMSSTWPVAFEMLGMEPELDLSPAHNGTMSVSAGSKRVSLIKIN